ncbi:glycerophosphodiester phosphodiesterase [Sphingomonas sp. LB-2]|uniref:glycerophosphodiester phosphodiesterase n=1 Tax=Sphingomonas caeni TaxID=2984949 RepID=UPI002230203A|nr:glycerophosphodiester phosphodiesterase [Sphingomonas caeni]MCW3847249.1 glycerophosphodiester phosphodiesterase [Sphingomonas caeni]
MARALVLMVLLLATGCAPVHSGAVNKHPVIVIAHRGASGERPEHTLLSYQLAIDQGADFIEPDLVPTKDGVLVARHENDISETTDVAKHPEFAARKTTKTIDGVSVTGWFTEDFTLAELRTLRARERLPQFRPGNTAYDGQALIPTLDEIIGLAKKASRETGRTIGIYPETKHPGYFAALGLPIEPRLIAALKAAGWNRADAPVFIQSFEVDNLRALHRITPVRLIQLMKPKAAPADGAFPSYEAMATPEGLRKVAAYAYGIGPEKAMILPLGGTPTTLVADAHAAGLKVHPWTFRAENFFLWPQFRKGANPADHGDLAGEIEYFLGLDVDGFFTDYPYIGAQARATWGSPAR